MENITPKPRTGLTPAVKVLRDHLAISPQARPLPGSKAAALLEQKGALKLTEPLQPKTLDQFPRRPADLRAGPKASSDSDKDNALIARYTALMVKIPAAPTNARYSPSHSSNSSQSLMDKPPQALAWSTLTPLSAPLKQAHSTENKNDDASNLLFNVALAMLLASFATAPPSAAPTPATQSNTLQTPEPRLGVLGAVAQTASMLSLSSAGREGV